ncbi:MAG: tryptophan synthase subunit beta, partial [Eikenella corrodens]
MQNYQAPDEKGFFGEHGGLYVAETLIPALQELADAYKAAKNDPSFWEEFHRDLKHYVGRPSPVYHAARLSEHLGGAQIWLKREDLNHTGAHKVNNTIGQALLARRMGKKRV